MIWLNFVRSIAKNKIYVDNEVEFDIKKKFGRLDRELARSCLTKYDRGEYQSAVRDACLVLEQRLRQYSQFDPAMTGTDLAKQLFSPNDGPLSIGETKSEQKETMFLYAGAMQAIRNPASHRFYEVEQQEARDIISFINFLLFLIEDAVEASNDGDT